MFDELVSEAEQLDEASVLADQLQADGDPRGELLALEIASVRAPSVEQVRALALEASNLRRAEARVVWPSSFTPADARLRAGFIVSFERGAPGQLRNCAPLPAMRGLRCIRGHRMDELEYTWASLRPAIVHTVINRTMNDYDDLGVLSKLRGIVGLDIGFGDQRQADEIAEHLRTRGDLRGLKLRWCMPDAIAPFAGAGLSPTHVAMQVLEPLELSLLQGFSRLHHLELQYDEDEDEIDEVDLAPLAKLPTLDSLSFCGPVRAHSWRRELERLRLRSLALDVEDFTNDDPEQWQRAHEQLDEGIEQLDIDAAYIDPERLRSLTQLRRLRLRLRGESPQLQYLPRVDELTLDPRVLDGLRELSCAKLTLAVEREAKPETELVGWRRLLDLLAERSLPALTLGTELDPELPEEALRVLARVEHLGLRGAPSWAQAEHLRELPRLRRLTVAHIDPAHHRQLSEWLPEVLVESTRRWPRARLPEPQDV